MPRSHRLPPFRLRYGGRAGKRFITEFRETVTLCVSRGRTTIKHDVIQKFGWAYYDEFPRALVLRVKAAFSEGVGCRSFLRLFCLFVFC